MVAQALARHLRIPGIVLLLAAGVVLGPDFLNVIRPQEALGDQALQLLVGFAVAIILFEGGMSLKIAELRKEARSIRSLVTIGAVVTAVGGTMAARMFLDWSWTMSTLFGTLVIVTGPTVINPLLKRIRVQKNLATVLEAEGVFIDAVGAIVAVVALEVVISSPSGESLMHGLGGAALRLLFGAGLGILGGFLIVALLRYEKVVPEGLENTLTLSLVLLLFQISNGLVTESGIAAVTLAGLTVGNIRSQAQHELREFKEQLTVMFIGMLFVLLAADVRIEQVQSLGWPGFYTVLALMFVVRPLNILFSTIGAGYNWRELAFLSWIAPRGIVAAAVASLFALELGVHGIEGGADLRALVFLVIAVTVVVAGLTGGLVAKLLGVQPELASGFAILGANPLGLTIGRSMRVLEQDVVFIDSNPINCRRAEEEGFKVLYGSGMSERILGRAELPYRAGVIGATLNVTVNYAFARRAIKEYNVPRAYVALRRDQASVTPEMVRRLGASILFGRPRALDRWIQYLTRGTTFIEAWRRVLDRTLDPEEASELFKTMDAHLVPVVSQRKKRVVPVGETTSFRDGDVLHAMVRSEGREQVHEWLLENGWTPELHVYAQDESIGVQIDVQPKDVDGG